MPYFTYDTSVIISKKLTELQRMPPNFLMSAVVLMELMAGAEDRSIRKVWEGLFRHYQGRNLLIVPTIEDWFLAGKILYLLTHSRKLLEKGKLQRLPPGASQRLAVDALARGGGKHKWSLRIGRTSRRFSVTATPQSSERQRSSRDEFRLMQINKSVWKLCYSALMTTKKNLKTHTSTRKKSSPKSKASKKKNERLERLRKLEQLTLKAFQMAYESNQRGEFRRL